MKTRNIFVKFLVLALIFSLTVVVGCSSPANPSAASGNTAAAKALPDQMSWVSYEVGSAGYAQAAAMANALTKQFGTKIRIMPADTSVGRIISIINKQAKFGFVADETSFAVEGTYDFASNNFGPQNLRVLLAKPAVFTLATTKDSGIEKVEDCAGKRVYNVPGNTSHTVKMEAFLAFGGLTWDDVKRTDMPSYTAGMKGLAEGKVDVVCCNPNASTLYEVASSPKGLRFLEFPASNTEGWKRLQAICPWMRPGVDNRGAEVTRDYEWPFYAFPQIVTLADTSEEEVYQLIKALDETFNLYKDSNAEMPDWNIKAASQIPAGAPFHPGAVKYLKEKGLWTDQHEAWNNKLIERMNKLQEAWKTVSEEAIDKQVPSTEYANYWLSRKAELVPQQ